MEDKKLLKKYEYLKKNYHNFSSDKADYQFFEGMKQFRNLFSSLKTKSNPYQVIVHFLQTPFRFKLALTCFITVTITVSFLFYINFFSIEKSYHELLYSEINYTNGITDNDDETFIVNTLYNDEIK